MEILSANNIEKTFEHHCALSDVSIKAEEGKIFGLLGPNGAGKTTLIRIINQITGPDKGEVFFKGEKLKQKHIEFIGYLPEERGLYKKMKVGEQAIYLAQLKGMTKADALKKLKYWFEKFEIQSWWDKKVEELSKGMAQKVQFITTVLHEPQLLIFDEPFSGFDPINANLMKNEILELKRNGASVIFSTHNMESVEELCDHIALINKSKKILDGEIHEVRNRFKSNIYELIFEGNFNAQAASLTVNYEIMETMKINGNIKLKVKLMNNYNSNNLLADMIGFGKVISFRELIPSMNDIFISVVEEENLRLAESSKN